MHTQFWRRSPLYARDGSGNYSRTQADYVGGTTIEVAKINSELNDMASALTQSVSKDGQTTYTASQPMGGFKLTGLGNGTGTGESIRYDEFKMAFRSHLAGLQMTSRTNTTIVYAAGSWTDDSHARVFSHAGGTINCATTGALGLDAGSLANNTWYHAFAIAQTDGTTSLLASTSVSAPTMPGSYTLKRRIGSFKTNGSAQIIDFIQDGDLFQWVVATTDFNANPLTTPVTLNVPTGLSVIWVGSVDVTNSAGQFYEASFFDFGVTTTAKLAYVSAAGTATNVQNITPLQVRTSTTATVVTAVSGTPGAATVIRTAGWIDTRGRNA